jgi:hypothetical protein
MTSESITIRPTTKLMQNTNTATSGQTGQLSDDQIIAQLPPEMQEQYKQWKRTQAETPQTPDTEAAKEKAEREKSLDSLVANSEEVKQRKEEKAKAIKDMATKQAKQREDRKEREKRRKKEPVFGPVDQRVVMYAEGEWRTANKVLVSLPQADQVCAGAIYDHEKGSYWIPDAEDKWIKVNETGVKNHLHIHKGIPKAATKDPETGEPIGPNPLDEAMSLIARTSNVELVAQIAGYSKGVYSLAGSRVLVPKSPSVIQGKQGAWDFLKGFIHQFFASEVQTEHVLGWMSWARLSLVKGTFSPGQALVLAGEQGCGKNAFLELVVTLILGGRSANPFQYMVGQTSFNADLVKAEHLMISDQPPALSFEDRVTFGSKMKDLTVNREQRLHPKGRDAVTVTPFRRLSIAVNDDEDSLSILPPLEEAILEKMMLFRVERPDCLPTDSSIHAQREFAEKITKDLPAFIYYLENEHQITPELADGRFGIKAHHHPIFIENIIDSSPEGSLWDMMERAGIVQTYDGSGLGGEYGEDGKLILGSGRTLEVEASDIYDKLRENLKTKEEASKYLSKRPNTRLRTRPGRSLSRFYSFSPPPQTAEEPF